MAVLRFPARALPKPLALLTAALLAAMPVAGHDDIAHRRLLEFPDLADGRQVLVVDLHTHTVFSDGSVWPDIRVREAERDGLFAYAVTEHMEDSTHRNAADIPQPDRNRPFEIATHAASNKPATIPGKPVRVINGTEITKAMPPGHLNAVFVTDVNEIARGKDAEASLAVATRQGAFVFFNHPFFWEQVPDGLARLFPQHLDWVRRKMLHGIEVANGIDASDEAFQLALDHNLTILGTSDIHGLIDWEYKLEKGQQRTVTLVLAADRSLEGLRAALFRGDTIALENDTLMGRPEHVQAVVASVLRLETGQYMSSGYMPKTTVIGAKIVNDSPIDFIVENIGRESIYQGTSTFIIPAHSSYELLVNDIADAARFGMTLRIVNAYVAPRKHLDIRLEGRRR